MQMLAYVVTITVSYIDRWYNFIMVIDYKGDEGMVKEIICCRLKYKNKKIVVGTCILNNCLGILYVEGNTYFLCISNSTENKSKLFKQLLHSINKINAKKKILIVRN